MAVAAKESEVQSLPAALTTAAPFVAPNRGGRGTFLLSLTIALAAHGGVLWAMVSGHLRLGAGGRVEEAIEVTVVDATILESLTTDTSKEAEATSVPSEDGNAPKDAIASQMAPPAKPEEKTETKPEEKTPPREVVNTALPTPEPPKESRSISQAPPELKRPQPPAPPPPAATEPPIVTAALPAPEAAPEQKEPEKAVEHTSVIEPVVPPPQPEQKSAEQPPKPEPKKSEPRKPEAKKSVEKAEPKSTPRPPSEAAKKGTNSSRTLETAANKNGKATATPGEANQYAARVRSKIARNRPDGFNQRGTTIVAFVISNSGGLSQVSVASSSGNARLDQAALQAVRNSAPFPTPPPGLSQRQLTFSINFVFQ
jgi:TonB family protein